MFNDHQRIFHALIDAGVAPYVAEQCVRGLRNNCVDKALIAIRSGLKGWKLAHQIIGMTLSWADTKNGMNWWIGRHAEALKQR